MDWQTLHRYFIADLSNHCALGAVAYDVTLSSFVYRHAKCGSFLAEFTTKFTVSISVHPLFSELYKSMKSAKVDVR